MPETTPEKGSNPAETKDQAQQREALEQHLTPPPKVEVLGIPRGITTEAEKDHLMDAARPMIGQAAQHEAKPPMHTEPGYEMLEKIPEDDLKGEVQKLITVKADLTKPGGANALQEQMSKLHEQSQK